jgi:hypothetical protein
MHNTQQTDYYMWFTLIQLHRNVGYLWSNYKYQLLGQTLTLINVWFYSILKGKYNICYNSNMIWYRYKETEQWIEGPPFSHQKRTWCHNIAKTHKTARSIVHKPHSHQITRFSILGHWIKVVFSPDFQWPHEVVMLWQLANQMSVFVSVYKFYFSWKL